MITKREAFESVRNAAEKKLAEVYFAGVPAFVSETYEKELSVLERSDKVYNHEMFRLVSEAARKGSFPISAIGGHLIAYLIGYMTLNPLPAHYYCPKCGFFEIVNDMKKTEFELLPKKCKCGNTMLRMGINIPFEAIWGKTDIPANEVSLRICRQLVPFIARSIRNRFGSENVYCIRLRAASDNGNNFENSKESIAGIALMSEKDKSEKYHVDLSDRDYLTSEEVYRNRIPHISFTMPALFSDIYDMQQKSGVYMNEININYEQALKDILSPGMKKYIPNQRLFAKMKPETITELAQIMCLEHNAYNGYKKTAGKLTNEDIEYIIQFAEKFINSEYMIAFREDAFVHLTKFDIPDNDRILLYELFRNGKSTINEKFDELAEKYSLPNELSNMMKQYLYLFPKEFNYSMICTFLLMAEYHKIEKKLAEHSFDIFF